LYRRHLKACPHKSMKYRRCRCPVWAVGMLNGEFLRLSLNTVSWERATRMVREWELSGSKAESVSVSEACEKFIAFCEAKHLSPTTLKKYKLLTRELKDEFGARPVSRVSADDLDSYRKTWSMKASSARKKLERLRKFFRFCMEREWTHKNPATYLDAPKMVLNPTLPFNETEMENILWATEVYRDDYGKCPREYAKKIKPFVLMLRFSGLRIGDVVSLERERIQDGKLFLYSQKTGVPVWLPLPEEVLESLEQLRTSRHYFWSGNGSLESAVKDWQRTLRQLFKIAGVKGHAHQFRDYFAVSLLQKGVPLETVAVLLGHQNIRITQKHYNPWVKSRQENLEREVKKTWQ
jgi:integrase/recombinase XerD